MYHVINIRMLGFVLIILLIAITDCSSPWQEWWMYEGVSGPHYWGKINTKWILCSKGKNQSPINIEPKDLLFDPGLKHIKLTGKQINGTLINKGTDLTFELHSTSTVLISLGPLSYIYRLHQVKFHFGGNDNFGSEHSVDGKHFAAEIQLMFYNSDLYTNFTQAVNLSRGVVILAIFVKVKDNENHNELSKITNFIEDVRYKGEQMDVNNINLLKLIPDSRHYMTYDGSITQPGCQETVTWIIMNRPITVSKDQIYALRTLRQDLPENPQALMFNNYRPTQTLNQRTVRTNINFVVKGCSMQRDMQYKVNEQIMTRNR
ncbi:carbonic anhydrase-related protein 10-like [Mytilus galloprovincialis]|uniref:carbonic anhydrase-related protein 10-like n=1 Tax=Mytilus galloprovincialis TaxID=29158 RepID=UPI003F7B3A62